MTLDRAAVVRVGGAVALWTFVVIAGLLFFPWRMPAVPCARLVGTPGSRAACEPVMAAANQQVFVYETVPALAAAAVGYLVIVALELRRWRGRARASAA